MLQRTGKELDNTTGFETANPVAASQSQFGPGVRARQDNLGIEDEDPRWSEREEVGYRRRRRRPPEPEPDVDLGEDESDFQGQPGDPFEVLIKRHERLRKPRGRPETRSEERMDTGIELVDQALGRLGSRLYLVEGPPDIARAFLHQIACHVADTLPVLYLAVVGNPRDLVLKALARLSGTAAPGDLARARDVADRFRPIRDRLQIVTVDPVPSPSQIRARLQATMRQFGTRGALLAIDDLVRLAVGTRKSVPAPAPPLGPAGGASLARAARAPVRAIEPDKEDAQTLAAWIQELAALAADIDVPVLAVGPADLAHARLSFGVPGAGGRIALDLEGARQRLGRAARPGGSVVPLIYDPARASFGPG